MFCIPIVLHGSHYQNVISSSVNIILDKYVSIPLAITSNKKLTHNLYILKIL